MMKAELTLVITILGTAQSLLTEDCWPENELARLPDLTSSCCEDNQWLIMDEGELRCQENECHEEGGVLFNGECHDVLEDAICGEDALGKRLFVGEDGVAFCDCDKGWVRFKGKCYQEFTPAFCDREKILQLNTKPTKPVASILFGDALDILIEGSKRNFSCVENPCKPSSFPHSQCIKGDVCTLYSLDRKKYLLRSSWNASLTSSVTCHEAEFPVTGCEVVVGPGERLECCTPSNRTVCIHGPQLELFNVAGSEFRSCGAGKIYSKVIDKCVPAL